MEEIKDPEFRSMLAERMRALSDPTRIYLLHLLMEQQWCVHELAEQVGRSQATVSKHLAILSRSGFIRPRKEGVQTIYEIKDKGLENICQSMCTALRQYLTEISQVGIKKVGK